MKVILKNVRIGFVNVWEKVPGMTEGSELKYRLKVLIPKSDVAQIKKVEAAIAEANAAGVAKHGKAFASPSNFSPLQDGDEKAWEGFADCFYLSASTSKNIHIVDGKREPIRDQDAIYSGVYVNIVLDFYAFNSKAKKGVSVDLGNIQKAKDGDRWDGGGASNPEADFEILEDTEELPF